MSGPLPPQTLDPSTDEKKAAPLLSAGLPGYQAGAPPLPPAYTEPEQRSRCRRRCRRLGHVFVVLLLLWLGPRYFFRQPPRPHHPHDVDVCVKPGDWSEYVPDEGRHPHRFKVWRKTELSLPSAADDIFLVSTSNTMGALHVTEAADRDDIGVEVVVGFGENSDAFEKTGLCRFRGGNNGHRVVIFIPDHMHGRDVLFFNITVSLPERKDVTTISRFVTGMAFFDLIIEKLPTHKFDSVSFHSDGPIHVEDLVGNKIRIHSRGGPIEGTFNTTSSLDIKTSNAPIRAVVNAFNHDNAVPTEVNIRTNNGPISAELALISTHEHQTNGAFVVHTQTCNSPLGVNFTQHPPDAVLKLEAHTTNSPAHVHLHPSFEGVFKLLTSIFAPVVDTDEDVGDPTGRGRKRVVHISTVGRLAKVVDGDIEWVPQDGEVAPAGKVNVSTTHSPLRLSL